MDIIEILDDMIKQATEERSHYYVKSTLEMAKKEILELRAEIKELEYEAWEIRMGDDL